MIDNLTDAIAHAKEEKGKIDKTLKYWESINAPLSEQVKYEIGLCKDKLTQCNQKIAWLTELQERREADRWIPVSERLPENAKHEGALCPRCQVSTEYGVTEGWYNPDTKCWFVLVWYKYKSTFVEYEPDFGSGDIACVIKDFPVIAWRPLPEPYTESEDKDNAD